MSRRSESVFFTIALLAALGFLLTDSIVPISNWDTFFHLRFGQEFLTDWTLQSHELPGYGSAAWTPTQWLSQVVMAFLYNHYGFTGVIALFALLYCALILGVFFTLSRFQRPFVAVLFSASYLYGCYLWLTPRPALLGFVLALPTLYVFVKSQKHAKLAYLFIPIFVLWPMVHGSWIALLPLPFMLALAKLKQAERRTYIFAALGSALATCANPLTYHVWAGVFLIGNRGSGYTEFARLEITNPLFWLAVAALATSAYKLFRTRRALDLLVLLFALALFWYGGRTTPYVFLLTATLFPASSELRLEFPKRIAVGASMAALALAIPLALGQPRQAILPAAVDQQLSQLPAEAGLYTYDYLGSYVLFAHPQLQPIPHGYIDVYTDEELKEIDKVILLQPGWEDVLRSANVKYALLPSPSQDEQLLTDQGWTVLTEDQGAVVMQAPANW